jgi:hypothetical protein
MSSSMIQMWRKFGPAVIHLRFEMIEHEPDQIVDRKRELCGQLKSNKPDFTRVNAAYCPFDDRVNAAYCPFDDKGKHCKALLHNTNVTELVEGLPTLHARGSHTLLHCIRTSITLRSVCWNE